MVGGTVVGQARSAQPGGANGGRERSGFGARRGGAQRAGRGPVAGVLRGIARVEAPLAAGAAGTDLPAGGGGDGGAAGAGGPGALAGRGRAVRAAPDAASPGVGGAGRGLR